MNEYTYFTILNVKVKTIKISPTENLEEKKLKSIKLICKLNRTKNI